MEWLVQHKSTGDEEDVIEDVTGKTLSTLVHSVDNLVVLFCKLILSSFLAINSMLHLNSDDHGDEDSMQVLGELEKIDDDCDKHGIQFVKIDDDSAMKEWGLESVPAIVYFEKGLPNIYDGDLDDESTVLEWLVQQLERDEIEDVTDEMLDKLIKQTKALAVLFCTYRHVQLTYT